jgi:hypothetical protein
MPALKPADCDVFIQIWVDVRAVNSSSGESGIYLVDNRAKQGSSKEGTSKLISSCARHDGVCWAIVSIDPHADAELEIQSIGNSNGWGPAGQPKPYGTGNEIFIGEVENNGHSDYLLTLNVNHTTLFVHPGVNVN